MCWSREPHAGPQAGREIAEVARCRAGPAAGLRPPAGLPTTLPIPTVLDGALLLGVPGRAGGERLSPIIRRPHGFTARSAGAAALVCVLAGIAGSARDALAGRHTHPAARTSIELK